MTTDLRAALADVLSVNHSPFVGSDGNRPCLCAVHEAARAALDAAPSVSERIADDNGDELEHGEPDFPGQFRAAPPAPLDETGPDLVFSTSPAPDGIDTDCMFLASAGRISVHVSRRAINAQVARASAEAEPAS